MLPVEWVQKHREQLWSRAVAEYRKLKPGEHPWNDNSDEWRQLVAERNADFETLDPWDEPVAALLEKRLRIQHLPVTVHEVLEELNIDVEEKQQRLLSRYQHRRTSRLEQRQEDDQQEKEARVCSGHTGHTEDTPGCPEYQ